MQQEFGNELICLQRLYPERKELFVKYIEVAEVPSGQIAADVWLRLQAAPVRAPAYVERVIAAAYRYLRGIAYNLPPWWNQVKPKLKIWGKATLERHCQVRAPKI